VVVHGYAERALTVEVRVAVDPAYEVETVLAGVATALTEGFAFEKRDCAQDVTESEAIAAMQAVAGAVFVDLDSLGFKGDAKAVEGRLEARPARFERRGGHLPLLAARRTRVGTLL
jgi:hypothetical protein